MLKIAVIILIVLILGVGFYFLFVFKEKEIQPQLSPKSMTNEAKSEPSLEETKSKISIITVYDNYQVNPELETGWGFSALIKIKNQNILFDTGADSPTLLSNMEKMGIGPEEIDTIFLSHIHEDHTGGLEGILKINSKPTVYVPKSFPDSFKNKIKSSQADLVEVLNSTKIYENVYSTGQLGIWIKEQSLIVVTDKGLVIITGCAHPGIVDIIKKAKEIFPKKEVYLVLGGFHLTGASDSKLKSIIKEFRELGVQKVAPCHCSGDRTRELFKEEYQDDFIKNGVGKIIIENNI